MEDDSTTVLNKSQLIKEISRIFPDSKPDLFPLYVDAFAQTRWPRYAVKAPGGWRTRKGYLSDAEIRKHLAGELAVGCLGSWYPKHLILDIDNRTRAEVEEIRAGLSLNDRNSMLLSSESPDSYHIYARAIRNGKPPTIDLLQVALKEYARVRGIEIYPQRNRPLRLAFGKGQNCLDKKDLYILGWEKQLLCLERKDDFDLSTVKGTQDEFEFMPMDKKIITPSELMIHVDVPGLLKNGLQGPSTRDRAQFELVKYLWRQNVTREDACRFIWAWLCKGHNGFSKDFLKYPRMVQEHIRHQVTEYYAKMQYYFALPDRPHISHKGYICKPDILEIVNLCGGNLPRMRFAFELVKYMNPRRHRESVPIHSDRFIEWSSDKTYFGNLQYLEEKGILTRSSWYMMGKQSKTVKLDWPYKTEKEAVRWGDRTVESLNDAVRMTFKPAEFRELLRGYVKRTTALMIGKTLFEGCQEMHT